MLLVTIVALMILSLLSYAIFDRDLFAPPTVVCLGFFFGSLCTYYNAETWGLDFSSTTMWTVVLGMVVFIIGGFLAVLLTNIRRLNNIGFARKTYPANYIALDRVKVWLVIAFELVTVVLLYREMILLSGASVSWAGIMTAYRKQFFTSPEDVTMRLSGLLDLFIDASFAIALFFAYVVGNNMATKKKGSWLYWVPILLGTIISFMQGYRADMLRLWVALLVVNYTVKKRSIGWKKNKETSRMIRRMAASVLVIAAVFVLLRSIVGRTNADSDPLYYVTFYAGCPLAAFDIFLKNPGVTSTVWGKETFYYLNQNIGKWFNVSELRYSFPKEFRRSPNGTSVGNVFTALRAPIADFGIGGLIVVTLIMGFFFTWLYCRVRKRAGKSPVDFQLLLYAYIAYTFFMYFYNNYYMFISSSLIKMGIALIAIRWFFMGTFGFGNRRQKTGTEPSVQSLEMREAGSNE